MPKLGTAIPPSPRFAFRYEEWMSEAKCPRYDPVDWETANLPSHPAYRRHEAIKRCEGCPVLGDCAGFAVRTRSTDHIYAGVPVGRLDERGNHLAYAELERIHQMHKEQH